MERLDLVTRRSRNCREMDSELKRPQAMLRAKLVVVGGAPEGDEFPLHPLPCTLGRAKSSTLPLPHPLVSREHCKLFLQDGQLRIRDLGSTNGTFVGSERIEECVVRDGDLITIGTVTFRALFEEPASERLDEANRPKQDAIDTTMITRVDTGVMSPVRPAERPSRRRRTAK